MNKGVMGIAAVAVCAGALYGVYHFRTTRLMPAQIKEIAEAQRRISQAEAAEVTPPPAAEAPAASSAAPAEVSTAEATPGEKRPDVPMPDATPDTFDIAFETSKGDVVIRVYRDWAPHGADRIFELFKEPGFYQDMKFFRVVNDPQPFVVQWGIPAQAALSSKWMERTIPDDTPKKSNTRGLVTFAAAPGAANSRSVQIFVNLTNNDFLDRMGFAPFGEVIEGMEIFGKLNGQYGDDLTQMQSSIMKYGNAFLDKRFPGLDYITGVRYLGEPPAEVDTKAAEEAKP